MQTGGESRDAVYDAQAGVLRVNRSAGLEQIAIACFGAGVSAVNSDDRREAEKK